MMPKTIISILGTSGAKIEREACLPLRGEDGGILYQSALYRAESLGREDAVCKNATEFLLEHYEGKFFFIGTRCAIAFQKIVLSESLSGKDVSYIEIEDNSLNDIFESILTLLNEHDDIVLDITHGFRHQPIMAIFASTLSQFLHREELDIIFAKEVEAYKVYEYIYLDTYIDVTHISLLLTGFIRTLNFVPVQSMKLLNNKLFENFSKSLLSNDLRGVEKHYALLKEELHTLKANASLSHISGLLEKVERELKPLSEFGVMDKHTKYLSLCKMTTEKNYLIVALAYLFESLRTYASDRFKGICEGIKYRDDFARKQDIMNAIINADRHFKTDDNLIYKKHQGFYDNNKPVLDRVGNVYLEIRKLRNTLAHINEHKEFDDIKKMLYGYIFKVESLYRDDVFKHLKV